MPKSKQRSKHKQKKAHWKLMMQHHKHGIAKLHEQMMNNIIAAAQKKPGSVAEMLNDEEKDTTIIDKVEETLEDMVDEIVEDIKTGV